MALRTGLSCGIVVVNFSELSVCVCMGICGVVTSGVGCRKLGGDHKIIINIPSSIKESVMLSPGLLVCQLVLHIIVIC